MLRISKWLVGLVVAALLLPMPVLADELSGSVEIGGGSVGISDVGSKVNEYTDGRGTDGPVATGKVAIEARNENAAFDINAEVAGQRDQKVELKFDLGRIIRAEGEYSVLEHQLDHETLDWMDASISRPTTTNPWPGVLTPNAVPGFMLVRIDPAGVESVEQPLSASTFAAAVAAATVLYPNYPDPSDGSGDTLSVRQTGGASIYSEDLVPGEEFKVTRTLSETGVEVALPFLPGVTFDIGYRHETREGTEQSISMSKCSSCHITGGSRKIDEETTDLKAGLTGKFGLLTLRYELDDREFVNKADAPEAFYDKTMKPGTAFSDVTFANRVSYDYTSGALAYDDIPESEKLTHSLKARVDLPRDTTVVGSYVTSETESVKYDEPEIFSVAQDKLKASYDGYGVKAVGRITDTLKLSGFVKAAEVEVDDADVTFTLLQSSGGAGITGPINPTYPDQRFETTGTRDSLNAGLDLVWRLARKSTLRLGYEYDVQDRKWDDLETTTHTLKAKYSTRFGKDWKMRLGYQFDKIDDPFKNPNAAYVPTKSIAPTGVTGDSRLYGTDFYDARVADLTSQPETVHEAKFNATWSPGVTFATTLAVRYAREENELNYSTWEQDTLVPTLSAWYAATDKLSLTAAANYFDQRSKTAFCQGFYDG